MICDAHVHFFSPGFFDALGAQKGLPPDGRVAAVARPRLGSAASVAALADRWVARARRARRVARRAHRARAGRRGLGGGGRGRAIPTRFVGFFMLDPTRDDALDRVAGARRTACAASACSPPCTAIRSTTPDVRADLRAGRGRRRARRCSCTAACCRSACARSSACRARSTSASATRSTCRAWRSRIPQVPIIIPHFGAGMFREALMVADLCPNVHLDTSSSNAWMRYTPGLTLTDVFRTALDVVGPERLLFGTDSSFFPRGWQPARARRHRSRRSTPPGPRPSSRGCARRQFHAAVSGARAERVADQP